MLLLLLLLLLPLPLPLPLPLLAPAAADMLLAPPSPPRRRAGAVRAAHSAQRGHLLGGAQRRRHRRAGEEHIRIPAVNSFSQIPAVHPVVIVGQEFVLSRALAKNEQLAFNYSAEWWRVRGLKRVQSGCAKYPLPRRPQRPAPSAADRSRRAARVAEQRRARLGALAPLLEEFLPQGQQQGDEGALLQVDGRTSLRRLPAGGAAAVLGGRWLDAELRSSEGAAAALAGQLGRALRPGGGLLLESDCDDHAQFTEWLRAAAQPFGAARAEMHCAAGGTYRSLL